MGEFLIVIGFLGLIVSVVMVIISAVKKTGKVKKRILYAVVCFVLMIIGGAISPPSHETAASTKNVDSSTSKNTDSEKEKSAEIAKKKQAEEEAKRKADEKAAAQKKAADAAAKKKADKEAAAKKKAEEANQPAAIAKTVTNDVNDQLGNQSNNDKKRVADIQVSDNADAPGGKLVYITLNGDENLTNNMTKEGMQMDSSKVFQSIFKNKSVNSAEIDWQFPMSDAFGNSSDDVVMKIKLTRDTYNKINWDNFDYKNYPTIADLYIEHPAFSK